VYQFAQNILELGKKMREGERTEITEEEMGGEKNKLKNEK